MNDLVIKKKNKKAKVDKEMMKPKRGYQKLRKKKEPEG